MENALDVLGVDRIDHAYTVLDNPALISRCIDQGILITVVPTNSYYLRTLSPDSWAQEHPIRQMARSGLKIHPNTDDPAFHLVDPIKCQRIMVEAFGYDIDDPKSFVLNGLEDSLLDNTTKNNLSKEWSEEFDELQQQYFKSNKFLTIQWFSLGNQIVLTTGFSRGLGWSMASVRICSNQ